MSDWWKWDRRNSNIPEKLPTWKNPPEFFYDKDLNRMLPNYRKYRCTCGVLSYYGGHSIWCDLITKEKSWNYND